MRRLMLIATVMVSLCLPVQAHAAADQQFSQRDGVDLKEHFETRLTAIQLYYDERLKAIDDSTQKMAAAMEYRLEGMNEFRNAMKDQQSIFVSRSEFTIVTKQLSDDLRMLRESKAELEGKASQNSVYLAIAVAILSLLIAFGRFMIPVPLAKR